MSCQKRCSTEPGPSGYEVLTVCAFVALVGVVVVLAASMAVGGLLKLLRVVCGCWV